MANQEPTMSSIPQKKTVFGDTSMNSSEMNHSSPSKKSLIPSGSTRKTNIPENKSSILLKKSKIDNSSVSRVGTAVDKSSVPGLQGKSFLISSTRPLIVRHTHSCIPFIHQLPFESDPSTAAKSSVEGCGKPSTNFLPSLRRRATANRWRSRSE